MFIPMIIGAIALGGAFDLYRVEPRRYHQIFDFEAVKEHTQITDFHQSIGFYKVTRDVNDAAAVVDVDPLLALQIMGGETELSGFSRYVHRIVNRRKLVEVVMTLKYKTVSQSFPQSIKQGRWWQDKPQRQVGTHFVSEIVFGGHLVVSLQFRPTEPDYLDRIRAAVDARIGSNGTLDGNFFENLHSLVGDVERLAELKINAYSSVGGLFHRLKSLKDVKLVVENYRDLVDQVNNGKGTVMEVGLEQIHDVQSSFPEFAVSDELKSLAADVFIKHDDLRVAIKEYIKWQRQGVVLSDQQELTVNVYETQLKRAYRAMRRAIGALDVTGSTSQFDKALKIYDTTPFSGPYKYTQELEKIIESFSGHGAFASDYSNLLPILQDEM